MTRPRFFILPGILRALGWVRVGFTRVGESFTDWLVRDTRWTAMKFMFILMAAWVLFCLAFAMAVL